VGHDRDQPARHRVFAQSRRNSRSNPSNVWPCRPSRVVRCSVST
jgi:hypothetical protein